MIQTQVHDQICRHLNKVEEWFQHKTQGLFFPIYSSFDIRDSGEKIAPVDANLFPAGFNNICQVDKENASAVLQFYLQKEYSELGPNIVILAEEHTKNTFYWENIYTLLNLLKVTGHSVQVALPRSMEPLSVQTYSGNFLKIYGAYRKGDSIEVDGQVPDLIICNNDFSNSYTDWVDGLNCLMNPPYHFGWYQRKKSQFFQYYNLLSEELAHLIEVDPWLFHIKTEIFHNLDISEESSRYRLAHHVEIFLNDMKSKTKDPFVFIKNNSGTYGLGILRAESGEDIRNLNYKSRKIMKATKGGGKQVSEVIIQEGISSSIFSDEEIAEPTLYVVGNKLIGGFLRAHRKKGPKENLNSPGAIYKRLCVSDLQIDRMGSPMENVYGWMARLGSLAIAHEIKHYQP